MNSLLLAILIFLVTRFLLLKEGERLSWPRLGSLLVLLFGGFLLFFENALLLVCFLSLLHVGLFLRERISPEGSAGFRWVTLGLGLVLIFLWPGAYSLPIQLKVLSDFSPVGLSLMIAVFLCLKESNFFIRWFFNHYKLLEKVDAGGNGSATQNGRVIGMLERLILLFFLWEGAALAATFIVAVKGLARFKKMEEDQAFAEYVVIGTFLSLLLTILIFWATRQLG
jgi:hypothetical protein